MQKKEDLIQENIELRSRLELAEKWMRREIAISITRIQKEKIAKRTRASVAQIWKEDGLDLITGKIHAQFAPILELAPKYTLERLIDADIYWHTLQQYPHMDALPVVLAYQKILDAWIEQTLIASLRISLKNAKLNMEYSKLDIDIVNIVTKNYTLSLGRLYQILQTIRENNNLSPILSNLVTYWKEHNTTLLEVLVSDAFFVPFTELIEREVFTRKRHESKVTYSDAKIIREVMIGNISQKSFLEMIFSI
jgi:hypothetical protein